MGELETRFGRLVAAQRGLRKWTQAKLAQESGVSVDMISKIESGRTGVRFPMMQKLSTALGVDVAAFFSVDAESPRRSFQNVMARLAVLSDDDLAWADDVLAAVLKQRKAGQSQDATPVAARKPKARP
jgi:transcriptional regulator with XRE-family HTH domain